MDIFSVIIATTLFFAINPLIGLLVYMLPSILAALLLKDSIVIILLLNLIVGWFLPAWLVLFIWAILAKSKLMASLFYVSDKVAPQREIKDRCCQYCVCFFPKEKKVCPRCGREQNPSDENSVEPTRQS